MSWPSRLIWWVISACALLMVAVGSSRPGDGQARIEFFLLGLLVRLDLVVEQPLHIPDVPSPRPGGMKPSESATARSWPMPARIARARPGSAG